jgi:hypothetical protein
MIDTIVNSINAGFGNVMFVHRDNRAVVNSVMDRMMEYPQMFAKVPERIDLVHIDDEHDRMILDYSDNGTDLLVGIITWGVSENGKYHIFKSFEKDERFLVIIGF